MLKVSKIFSTKTLARASVAVMRRTKREILDKSDSSPRLGAALLAAQRACAKALGVHPAFLRRAEEVRRQTGSCKEAYNFLNTYIRLERGVAIDGYFNDFVSRLETPEEKRLTEDLLNVHIWARKDGEARDNLLVHLFRLKNAGPRDPEVLAFVEHSIKRKATRRGFKYKSRNKYFTRQDAIAAITQVREIFSAHGKRFFLISGTLLGAVRDGNFISNDYDIDLGVFSDEVPLPSIKEMFAGTGFVQTENYPHKVAFKSKKGLIVEFFACYRKPDHILMVGWEGVHTWYFSPFDLIEYEFLGEKFLVPDNYEKNLEENFGNWRRPTVYYDVSYDVPARVYGNNVEALVYLTNRFCRSLENGWRDLSYQPAKNLRDYFGIDYTDYFPKVVGKKVLPPIRSMHRPRRLMVFGVFNELTPEAVRVLESARSLCEEVFVAVVPDTALGRANGHGAPLAERDRIDVAKCCRHVHDAYVDTLEPEFGSPDLRDNEPKAIAVSKADAGLIPQAWRGKYPIVEFGPGTACLTLDKEGQVAARAY